MAFDLENENVAYAQSPNAGNPVGANWLWAWAMAVPTGSPNSEAAHAFIEWATSKEYTELVAAKKGWVNVPPGTRASLYNNPDYMAAAPFAQITLDSIQSADPINPTVKPVPYVGVQFVAIPEFQGIGTTVSQLLAEAFVGDVTVEQALENANEATRDTMEEAGYYE